MGMRRFRGFRRSSVAAGQRRHLSNRADHQWIVSTSSFPYLTMFPFPSEVVQLTEGSSRRMEIGEIQRREQFDTMKPVSRSCLLFGSAEAADAVPRPPTLRESELGTAPLLRRFDFYQGSLCAFRELSARVCMDARDVRERRIGRTIVAAAGIAPVANGNCDRREDVHVIYRGEWLPTASPRDRRDVAVHAEVRLDRRGRGTVAGAVWSDNRGGTVDAVATRFGHDLAEFFTAATAATCAQ